MSQWAVIDRTRDKIEYVFGAYISLSGAKARYDRRKPEPGHTIQLCEMTDDRTPESWIVLESKHRLV